MENVSAEEIRMIKESKLIYPDPEKVRQTVLGSVEAFDDLLHRSWEDPAAFWAGVASELYWMRPWDKVMEGEIPHFRFFGGGVTNACYNMLDRHLEQGLDNRVALIWESEDNRSRFYTYRMLHGEVCRFANVLKGYGLDKGDRVAIFLPNLPETVIAVLACYRLGVLFNTVFSGFSDRALRDRLINYEPQVVITADSCFRRGREIELKAAVDRAVEGMEGVRVVVVVRRSGRDVRMKPGRDFWWDDLVGKADRECPAEPMEANEPGLVFYTSGTTGKPKGVVHSGVAFLVNNYVYAKFHMDHHPNDVFWCTADIGWLTMHIWGIVGALANGVTTIFYDGALDWPKPDRLYEIVDKYRVNKLFTAPTAIRMLMRFGEELMGAYDLSCLDVLSVVGEPFNPEAWHWAYEKLGRRRMYINNTWGQTETAGCPLAGAAWVTPMKPGSCGIQFLGAQMSVVDEEGHQVPPETPGRLIMTRPIPMLVRTLWKEPDRYLREYFSQVEGAYYANDMAIVDSDGHWWVTGRLDDVFNVAGHRLSTMELESAIVECPGVAEAAVIGIPHEIKGLVPVAFVTLRQGFEPDQTMENNIRQKVTDNISKIAVPEKIYFTNVMPKTPSGKIMRRLLKEIVVSGKVESDLTGLEDPSSIDRIKELVAGKR